MCRWNLEMPFCGPIAVSRNTWVVHEKGLQKVKAAVCTK
jgi:hypothetical protein